MSRYHQSVRVKDRHENQTELILMAHPGQDAFLLITAGGVTINFHFRDLAELANLFDDAVTAMQAPAAEGGAL